MIGFLDHPEKITLEWVAQNFDMFPLNISQSFSIECMYGILFNHPTPEYRSNHKFFGFTREEFIAEQKRLGIYKQPHRDGFFFVGNGDSETVLECRNGYWLMPGDSSSFIIDESLVIRECK